VTIPTLASVSPSSGLTTGGGLVWLNGSGFRLPPVPPVGHTNTREQQTVGVWFAGVRAPWAAAASATRALAQVPEWKGAPDLAGPFALAVRLANLDDAGAEIPTENVTLPNGYSVDRPNLAPEPYFQRVARALIHALKRNLHANVALTLGRDYDAATGDPARLPATLPAIYLAGPHVSVARRDAYNREDPVADPVTPHAFTRVREAVAVDLTFDLSLWADNPRHLMALTQAMLLMFRQVRFLEVLRDPATPALGSYSYELDLPWDSYPDLVTDPNRDDLVGIRAACIVRGVQVDTEAGTLVERGMEVTTNAGEPTLVVLGP
jgi:hypothetical protein